MSLYATSAALADAKAAAEAGRGDRTPPGPSFSQRTKTTSAWMRRSSIQAYASRVSGPSWRGKEVIIRTLDVGGDKGIACLEMVELEENPFPGGATGPSATSLDRPPSLLQVQLWPCSAGARLTWNIKIMSPGSG